MFKNTNPLFLICETQLHAGSGDDLGIVDLPIQRERHTSFPKIEASSFKGAVREAFENHILKGLQKAENDKIENYKQNIARPAIIELNKVFGFDEAALKGFSKEEMKGLFEKDNQEFAGCIAFTDARLLLFPVKSMKGVFAWITCPRVLRQFEKDMKLAEGRGDFEIKNLPNPADGEVYLVNADSNTKISGNVLLEEYAFGIKNEKETPLPNIAGKNLGSWLSEKLFKDQSLAYWEGKIKKDILILSDNDFKDFVNLSTEVVTRTKINNETGTVQDGALFTEEYLPSESILYTLVLTAPEFKKGGNGMPEEEVKGFFKTVIEAESIIQVGGNATLGKGIIRTKFLTQEGGVK